MGIMRSGVRRAWGFSLCAGLMAAGLVAATMDTRLADAVQNKDLASVRALLKQRVNVNAQQADGMTALLWAAHNDDTEAAKLLIAAGADAKLGNRYGIVPLAEAATNGSAAMTELLLKAGADPNATLPESDTILMLAARTGNADVVRMLIDKGAVVDQKEEWHGENALMIAAGENHAEVVKLLLERGADVNAKAKHLVYPVMKTGAGQVMSAYPAGGLTPLMQAVRNNAFDAVKVLIAAKADLNLKDPNNMSALHIAILNAHWDMANLLLESGANADDGSLGLIPEIMYLKYARAQTDRPNKLGPMDVIKIMLAKGARVDSTMDAKIPAKAFFAPKVTGPADATPLYRAAKKPDVELMRFLMENGADAKMALKDGTTPLMVAAGLGPRGGGMAAAFDAPDEDAMIEAIKLCMAKGADVNAVDSTGMTALHGAAQKGADKVVQFLADSGAKLDVKDKRDRTPLDIANGVAGKGPAGGMGAPPPEPHPSTAALLRKLMGLPAEEKTSEAKSAEAAQAQ
jgi:ankyrin repeat protein